MEFLKLSDLNNPEEIKSFLHKNSNLYSSSQKENTGFQAYYRQKYPNGSPKLTSLELWQKLKDGRLMKVKSWRGSSIICIYKNPMID